MILHSWSGGKDSTAAIILDHIHNLPPSTIIFSEVMFDRHRGISGEHPEHIRFVKDIAIPRFREWGYTVEVLHADSDYIENFHRVIQNSKIPERNGKIRGFPLGGRCAINRDIKIKAIKDYLKRHEGREITQYVGIAADEPRRLARLEGTNRISLLARYGYTEKMAYNLCAQYGLLSPLYEMSSRGGCWFCPNATVKQFAHIKLNHPELWDELKKLSKETNSVSGCFRYSKSFCEVDAEVDAYIKRQEEAARQVTIFDLEEAMI